MSADNKFTGFISKIFELPLWIKQVIYLKLKGHLEKSGTKYYLDIMTEDNIFQLYKPQLTFRGRKELETHSKGLDPNLYKFLASLDSNKNIIEITISNFWTLEECAKYFTDALDEEFILKPECNIINGMAYYLSGKIRLGEYFTRIGKINIHQLDEALRAQKQIQETTGDKLGIAGIMMNLGLVSEEDIQSILLIKEESKKRFLLTISIDSFQQKSSSSEEGLGEMQKELARLKNENKLLKEQLRKILNIKR